MGGELAPGQIVTIFGERLAAHAETAPALPLPIELGGARVVVTDSAGAAREASLFFASPQQINCLLPAETALGPATITVTSDDGDISTGVTQISPVAPGLFTANADGQGVAAASVLRVKSDGSQSFEPVASFDQAHNKHIYAPIDIGPDFGEQRRSGFSDSLRHRFPQPRRNRGGSVQDRRRRR